MTPSPVQLDTVFRAERNNPAGKPNPERVKSNYPAARKTIVDALIVERGAGQIVNISSPGVHFNLLRRRLPRVHRRRLFGRRRVSRKIVSRVRGRTDTPGNVRRSGSATDSQTPGGRRPVFVCLRVNKLLIMIIINDPLSTNNSSLFRLRKPYNYYVIHTIFGIKCRVTFISERYFKRLTDTVNARRKRFK